jgi:hypothetical protein
MATPELSSLHFIFEEVVNGLKVVHALSANVMIPKVLIAEEETTVPAVKLPVVPPLPLSFHFEVAVSQTATCMLITASNQLPLSKP